MSANFATMPATDRETVDPTKLGQNTVQSKSVEPGTAPTPSELESDSFTSPDVVAKNEFGYRPIPILAPITLAIGFCSIVGFVWPECLAVPLAGIVLGVMTCLKIRRSGGEYGGYWIAVMGLILSVGMFTSAAGMHAYTYATEVPDGYERLDFRWLSQQKPIEEDGRLRIADEAKALDGQKVFVKGYMYPQNQNTGLSRFTLCKDTGQCCFGGDPALTDMIAVEFVNKTRANFKQLTLVSVAGTFRAKKVQGKGGALATIYSLEAEYFK
jgi:hypothetical protein